MAKLVNLTPNLVRLEDEKGEYHLFPSEGEATVTVAPSDFCSIPGIPVLVEYAQPYYISINGLPETDRCLKEGSTNCYEIATYYIVSPMVAKALPLRQDLLVLGISSEDEPNFSVTHLKRP